MTTDTYMTLCAMQRAGGLPMHLANLAANVGDEDLAKIKATWPEVWARFATPGDRIGADAARGLAGIETALGTKPCGDPIMLSCDVGKVRYCERPAGHKGEHSTTYCGRNVGWPNVEAVK